MKTSGSHARAQPGSRTAKPARSQKRVGGELSSGVPARWLWHFQTLSELRERLIEERGRRLTEAAEPIERHSMHQADSATDEFDHELAMSRLSAEQDALCEVEAAMKRISDNAYGICEQTGKRISAARLRAVPWARFREDVEARLESAGEIPRSRLAMLRSVRGKTTATLAESEQTVEQPEPVDPSVEPTTEPTAEP